MLSNGGLELVVFAVAGLFVGALVLSNWLDARKGSRVLSEAEAAVANSLGYESYEFRTPESTDYRVRDLRPKDLQIVGHDRMFVEDVRGCPGGGTLIWGGSGVRWWLVFPDGKTEMVPCEITGDHVVGWPYRKPSASAQSLQNALDGLPRATRERMRYALREKWIEGEHYCWREVTVIRLPNVSEVRELAVA